MKFYFAPMEGITGAVYRRAHSEHFPGTDRYFTPFLATKTTGNLTGKERRDIEPAANAGLPVVPQLLSNRAEAFIHTARLLHDMGYPEINLNLGCPSGTVVSKGKGSGFLAYPDELDRFFEAVYSALDFPVSVKTRIGLESPDEAARLIAIFNRYPIAELTVHPRLQTDYYRNHPNREVFAVWLAESSNPLCYNGDLFSANDYACFIARFPQVKAVMLGRGAVSNPALIRTLQGGAPLNKPELIDFCERLTKDYTERFSGEKSVLYKVKEMWFYHAMLFSDYGRYLHRIQHAATLGECRIAVAALLREQQILPEAGYRPEHGGKMC